MYHTKSEIFTASFIVFISGVIGLLFFLFIVPNFEIIPSPEYFAKPGVFSVTILSAPLFYRKLLRMDNDKISKTTDYQRIGIKINVLLFLVGNLIVTVYTAFFWDMNGGGAMYPMLFFAYTIIGIPYGAILGGFSGWLLEKLIISGT